MHPPPLKEMAKITPIPPFKDRAKPTLLLRLVMDE